MKIVPIKTSTNAVETTIYFQHDQLICHTINDIVDVYNGGLESQTILKMRQEWN